MRTAMISVVATLSLVAGWAPPAAAEDGGAAESVESSMSKAGTATKHGLDKAGKATGEALEKGLDATGKGVGYVVDETGKGLKKAGEAMTGSGESDAE